MIKLELSKMAPDRLRTVTSQVTHSPIKWGFAKLPYINTYNRICYEI